MAAYITQVERVGARVLADQGALGTHAAGHFSGGVLVSETWQVNATTLDTTNLWTSTVTLSGTISVQTENLIRAARLRVTAVGDDATLAMGSNQPIGSWPATLPVAATTHRWLRTILEWTAKLPTATSIDNTFFFMGFGQSNAIRTSDNVAGFYLASDVMRTLSDVAATETTNAFTNPTLTDWNKYKIICGPSDIRYFVNDAVVAAHTTNIALAPSVGVNPSFAMKSDAAGTLDLFIGPPTWYYSTKATGDN